jgi:hypothetical protein
MTPTPGTRQFPTPIANPEGRYLLSAACVTRKAPHRKLPATAFAHRATDHVLSWARTAVHVRTKIELRTIIANVALSVRPVRRDCSWSNRAWWRSSCDSAEIILDPVTGLLTSSRRGAITLHCIAEGCAEPKSSPTESVTQELTTVRDRHSRIISRVAIPCSRHRGYVVDGCTLP